MSIFGAFARGTARIWIHKRLILWLYLVNLAFAAVLMLPFRKVIGRISRTDLSEGFVTGFPMDAGFEFWHHHSSELKALTFAAVGLGVLYLLFNILLTGGIVAALAVERRVSLRRFVNDATRYFGRYLRLFILLVVIVGAVVAAYNLLLADTIEEFRKNATTDRASFLWRALGVAVVLLFLAPALMVFDYARIRTVVERRRSMFLAVVLAFTFSLRRCWRTVPLFCLNLLIVGILFAVYLFVEDRFSNANVTSMVSLFAVQQVFILCRVWMRLSFFSTQLAYYQSTRKPVPQ